MKKASTIFISLICFAVAAYPMTSMHGTCAQFPLEDFFFSVYWPATKWLWHQGLNFSLAVVFSILVPNLVVILLAQKAVRRFILKGKQV